MPHGGSTPPPNPVPPPPPRPPTRRLPRHGERPSGGSTVRRYRFGPQRRPSHATGKRARQRGGDDVGRADIVGAGTVAPVCMRLASAAWSLRGLGVAAMAHDGAPRHPRCHDERRAERGERVSQRARGQPLTRDTQEASRTLADSKFPRGNLEFPRSRVTTLGGSTKQTRRGAGTGEGRTTDGGGKTPSLRILHALLGS